MMIKWIRNLDKNINRYTFLFIICFTSIILIMLSLNVISSISDFSGLSLNTLSLLLGMIPNLIICYACWKIRKFRFVITLLVILELLIYILVFNQESNISSYVLFIRLLLHCLYLVGSIVLKITRMKSILPISILLLNSLFFSLLFNNIIPRADIFSPFAVAVLFGFVLFITVSPIYLILYDFSSYIRNDLVSR